VSVGLGVERLPGVERLGLGGRARKQLAYGCHHGPFGRKDLEPGTCWNILVDISLI
jgi:hypothetical protein